MGEDLFDANPELTATADAILGYSVRDLCLKDPDSQLGLTQYTQPALYVVNALAHYRLLADGKRPSFVAGHSLGEYNALLAAEVFDFATGLRLVHKRGELMARARDGGMAAVLNKSEPEIREMLKEGGFDGIDIANLNAPAQIVLSGPREDIAAAKEIFKKDRSCRYVILSVSGAFHSRYMADAQREFTDFLGGFPLHAPKIPVVANVTARPYRADEVKETLVAQITSAVKWSETVRFLMGKGENELVEVGPGRVLTGLVANIRRDAEPLVVDEEPVAQPTNGSHPEVGAEVLDYPELSTDPEPAAVNGFLTSVEPEAEWVGIAATDLGSASFKRDYGLRYACVAGGLGHGIASKELVTAVGRAGMLGFLGTLGLAPDRVEADIRYVAERLSGGEAYGLNIVYSPHEPEREETFVDLCLRYGVRTVEAAGFTTITPALVRYRLSGLRRSGNGVAPRNRVIAKVSRPEVARAFLSPAPPKIVATLLAEGRITAEEAKLGGELPVAEDLCCEADSGGHTDQAVTLSLFPAILRLREELVAEYGYRRPVRLGTAGGIGAPGAVAASFMLGADFVMTGSINQCTVEAATSDLVKDILQEINIQDTGYAPAGDMFEYGSRVQVLRKGVLFPARANKLYELYKRYDSLEEIDTATAEQLRHRYFKKSFDEVYAEVRASRPAREIEKADQEPKQKMALVFRWYFEYSLREALAGAGENRVDFQVYCGPALGAFNQWAKGSKLRDWRHRHVGEINELILREAADLLSRKLAAVETV
jgi:trans-AT polyketide synthase/acyltransferase/oxidoreductase domain-containing protein